MNALPEKKVSKQRRRQIALRLAGLCVSCGRQAELNEKTGRRKMRCRRCKKVWNTYIMERKRRLKGAA